MTNAWFNHCQSLDEAKAEYRRLCFMYHPDRGGDHEVMQTVNRAYDAFKRSFKPRVARPVPVPTQPPRWSTQGQPRPQQRRWTASPPMPDADQHGGHSRKYVRNLWERVPWHALNEGRFIRRMWGHSATLVPYPPQNSDSTWVVFVDGDLSPYLFYSRQEAEQGAFEVIYDRVKYSPM